MGFDAKETKNNNVQRFKTIPPYIPSRRLLIIYRLGIEVDIAEEYEFRPRTIQTACKSTGIYAYQPRQNLSEIENDIAGEFTEEVEITRAVANEEASNEAE